MLVSLKQAGEAIAEIASKAGIQSEGGKLLTISEGFLAFIFGCRRWSAFLRVCHTLRHRQFRGPSSTCAAFVRLGCISGGDCISWCILSIRICPRVCHPSSRPGSVTLTFSLCVDSFPAASSLK